MVLVPMVLLELTKTPSRLLVSLQTIMLKATLSMTLKKLARLQYRTFALDQIRFVQLI